MKETSGNKRNLSVCEIPANKTYAPILFTSGDTKPVTEAQFMSVTAARAASTGYYKACYNIRSVGTAAAKVAVGSYTSGSTPGAGSVLTISNTDHKTVCDPVPHKAGSTRPFLKVTSGTVRLGSAVVSPTDAPKEEPTTPPVSSSSRCPAFPQFPNASCTGVLPGVSRGEFNGVKYTSKDGEVIENLNINGEIRVQHNNVTIRNVRVKSNGGNAIYVYQKTGLLVEDCELNGQSGNAEAAVVHGEYTMRRCHIYGYAEGPRINGKTILEDNYIHAFADFISQGTHQDGIQGTSASGVVVRHNTILIGEDYDGATYFDGANGAIFFSNGPGSDVLIEKNLVGGGNFAINLDHATYSNVRIIDNHITTTIRGHEKGGYIAPITGHRGSNWTVSGNVWHDGPNAGKLIN